MKSFQSLITALLLGAALIIPTLHAQKEGGGRRGDRLKMLTEQLSLTEAQVAEIKPIVEDQTKAMMALREDSSVTGEARRTKMREIMTSHNTQIRAKLTPEQQTKFDEMPVGPGGGGGKEKGKRKGKEAQN